MLWHNDEGVYVRTCLESAPDQVKSEYKGLTRSIDAKAIAPERKDLAAGFLHHRLREVFSLTDMFHEFDSDPLYELKCRFPRFT